MIAIVLKKSMYVRVSSILSRNLLQPLRVEFVAESVYFHLASISELSHASTCLYVAGIVHRCVIR